MEPSLFFVLSGYLVSGIIWKHGAYVGVPGPWRQRLRTFFTRRVLRIIPPYYLALVGALLLPLEVVQQHLLWFVLPALGPVLALLSTASWRWVEVPIDRFKDKLRYADTAP